MVVAVGVFSTRLTQSLQQKHSLPTRKSTQKSNCSPPSSAVLPPDFKQRFRVPCATYKPRKSGRTISLETKSEHESTSPGGPGLAGRAHYPGRFPGGASGSGSGASRGVRAVPTPHTHRPNSRNFAYYALRNQ